MTCPIGTHSGGCCINYTIVCYKPFNKCLYSVYECYIWGLNFYQKSHSNPHVNWKGALQMLGRVHQILQKASGSHECLYYIFVPIQFVQYVEIFQLIETFELLVALLNGNPFV